MSYNDIISNIHNTTPQSFSNMVVTKNAGLKWKNISILMLVLIVCVQALINSSLDSQLDKVEHALVYHTRTMQAEIDQLDSTNGDLEIQAFMCAECTATFE